MSRNFNFKWKVIENYVAAFSALAFLWFFVNGIVNKDGTYLIISLVMIAVAPLLIAFVDRKSSGL